MDKQELLAQAVADGQPVAAGVQLEGAGQPCRRAGTELQQQDDVVSYVRRLAQVRLDESRARAELLANAIFHRAREVVPGNADPFGALRDDPGLRAILESSIYGENVTDAVIVDTAGVVRAAAQQALDQAVAQTQRWQQVSDRHFGLSSTFANFEEFETKQMRPSYADHRLDDAKVAHVRAAFEPFQGPAGATFVRPLHVRVLRRLGS